MTFRTVVKEVALQQGFQLAEGLAERAAHAERAVQEGGEPLLRADREDLEPRTAGDERIEQATDALTFAAGAAGFGASSFGFSWVEPVISG